MDKEEKIKQIIKEEIEELSRLLNYCFDHREENSKKEFDYISILIAKKGTLSDILERINETKEEK